VGLFSCLFVKKMCVSGSLLTCKETSAVYIYRTRTLFMSLATMIFAAGSLCMSPCEGGVAFWVSFYVSL